jgi:uncharacterized protein (TIGR03437 family)
LFRTATRILLLALGWIAAESLFVGAAAAQTNAPVIKSAVTAANGTCPTIPPAKTTFQTTDNVVWFVFSYTGGNAGDVFKIQFIQPKGTVYVNFSFTQSSTGGSSCYDYYINVGGAPPAGLPGNWTVNVLWNGTQITSVPFVISPPPTGTEFTQIISTIAGTTFTFPSRSLLAVNAPTGITTGVALDSSGNLYVSDAENCLVYQVNPAGTLSVYAGNGTCDISGDGGRATNAALFSPMGLAVDSSGNLYIADQINCRIRMVTPAGIMTTVAGNGAYGYSGDGGPAKRAMLNFPTGVAVDSSGDIYIADQDNHVIRKVTAAGIISTIAGNGMEGYGGDTGQATAAKLNYPAGVALDTNGNLYIADADNDRIRKVTPGGIITTVAGNGSFAVNSGGPATGGGLANPVGVTVDGAGNIYIAEGEFGEGDLVQKVTPGGVISTIAGTGPKGFFGDGGPAGNALLATPQDVVVDSSGNVYIADTGNRRVRKLTATGLISTVVGNGNFRFGGDGGAATVAYLSAPVGIAIDPSRNVYFTDVENNRVRKIAPDGDITTIAGNGIESFSGDGGQAVNASLDLRFPTEGPFGIASGVAVDSAGNVYFADTDNDRIRMISTSGIITTVAGGGAFGVLGDGGPANKAYLSAPSGIHIDPAGNIYIADFGNNRIRKISTTGIITTIAGGGTLTSPNIGDGGQATSAVLNGPEGVALDSSNNLYISDSGNNRVRKVTAAGVITTVVGNGTADSTGDGGLATQAASLPDAVALDQSGNLYVIELAASKIRMVNSSGIINTIVGTGTQGFLGDGGPAANAQINLPSGAKVDAAGNIFIADTGNNRIREVQAVSPTFTVSPPTLSFTGVSGGVAPAAQVIQIGSSVAGLPFTVQDAAPWTTLSVQSGTLPFNVQVIADPSQLAAGSYTDSIIITVPGASPSTFSVSVSFTVTATAPQNLSLSEQSLSFSATTGAAPAMSQLTLSNQGSGSLTFTASALASTGGSWIQISPASGTVTAGSPVSLTVTANPGNLAAGTYAGSISVASASSGQSITAPVTLAISAPPEKIVLTQLGFTFVAVAQGGSVLPQNLYLFNGGSGSMNWTASAVTASGGSWLSASPSSGTVSQGASPIAVSVNPSSLAAGTYYGRVIVSAPGAGNSPQSALVVLSVLAAGSNPGPNVQPSGFVFTSAVGNPNPGSKDALVDNVTAANITFGSAVAYNPDVGAWIKYLPQDATVVPSQPTQIVLQPDFGALSAGVYRGALALIFNDGEIRTVGILTVIAPSGTTPITPAESGNGPFRPHGTNGCMPSQLYPIFIQLGTGSSVPGGWPVALVAEVVDDCGNAIDNGSVIASFNNGDAPVSLMDIGGGQWTGGWQPQHVSSGGVTVTLTARVAAAALSGVTQQTVGMQGSQSLPVLSALPMSAVTQTPGPFAPGDLVWVQGSGLADSQASASSASLPPQLAGASVLIGNIPAPLLYADKTQVIAQIPLTVPVNSTQQVTTLRDATIGLPSSVIISATHPTILSKDGSGQGQGLVYNATSAGATTLANVNNPAKAGGTIVIYCSGLGAVDANGNATNVPTVTLGDVPATITYAGVALPAAYPNSGAPMLLGGTAAALGGLYQITATVPPGIGGQVPVSISSAGAVSQTGLTMMLAPLSGGGTPTITSIDTAGGFPTIAQNGWIEIKGSNLAPSSVGSGVVWSSAPDFAFGQMPTELNGVSATVNGNAAFIYYVSPTQINVLSPLDSTTGPVQVVVNNNGVTSAAFTITEKAAAPSFLLFGATKYIVATHTNFSLAGPASLSAPGYPFTPVAPGETVIFYAVGFGLPSTPLVDGSATQSGSLPTLPVITIGGNPATVSFAGVISPGLYQFNVVIPSNAQNGDNTVTCSYGGLSTPTGDLITVQK